MTPSKKTVLVLAGGDSPERDVSLESARGISEALREAGYRVLVADPARPDIAPSEDPAPVFAHAGIGEAPPEVEDDFAGRAEFTRVLSAYQSYGIDVVFVGLHGGAGEDGTMQAVLEYLGVPFTGSGSAACAMAMNKHRTKLLAQAAGVPVPRGLFLARAEAVGGNVEREVAETMTPPIVVKPNAQGSSVGLSIVEDYARLGAAIRLALTVDSCVLIEEYIEGRELTQAFVEGQPNVPLLEIRPRSGVYDYVHKYQSGHSEYIVPAQVDKAVAMAVAHSTRRVVDALGMRAYARVDFRLDAHGNHFLLEANALPGMTAASLVPKACKAIGLDYTALCDRIVRLALPR